MHKNKRNCFNFPKLVIPMKKYIYISLLIVLTFTACKKDPDTKEPSVPPYTHQDLTAYSYFKTGTYWIYKDSTSGVEDSVYVYYDTSFLYHQTGTVQADGDYMFYNTQSHSYYDSYNYNYKISMGYYSITNGQVGTVRIKTKPGAYNGETFLMSSCFENNNVITWYLGSGSTYYKGFYNSTSILGVYYYNVAKFYDSNNASEYNSPTNFYIAKNIGIIRKEKIGSNIVWNLIRYHIIQ